MNTYKSRFGYHSIDYSTYLKLKKLYKAFWQTATDIGKWNRWYRKRPENRIGPEPRFFEEFSKSKDYISFTVCDRWRVCESFRNARVPKATEEEVTPCKISISQIDILLRKWEEYNEEE